MRQDVASERALRAAAPVASVKAPSAPSAPRRAPSTPPPQATQAAVVPAANRDLEGKTIDGKYVVKGILGRGGMGTVFEAEQLALGRRSP